MLKNYLRKKYIYFEIVNKSISNFLSTSNSIYVVISHMFYDRTSLANFIVIHSYNEELKQKLILTSSVLC